MNKLAVDNIQRAHSICVSSNSPRRNKIAEMIPENSIKGGKELELH